MLVARGVGRGSRGGRGGLRLLREGVLSLLLVGRRRGRGRLLLRVNLTRMKISNTINTHEKKIKGGVVQ